MILGCIAIIICLTSLCYSIYVYKTYRPFDNKNQSLSLSLKILNFCGVLSFLLCAISQTIGGYYFNYIYWKWTTVQTLTWHFTYLFWSCGQFFSYLLFLNRIKETFQSSYYSPSKLAIYYIHSLLAIFGITWLVANIVPFMLFFPHDGMTREIMHKIEFYCSLPIMSIDIILIVSMTYMFVSRLVSYFIGSQLMFILEKLIIDEICD